MDKFYCIFLEGGKGLGSLMIISHYGCPIPSQKLRTVGKGAWVRPVKLLMLQNATPPSLWVQILLSYEGKSSPTIAISC